MSSRSDDNKRLKVIKDEFGLGILMGFYVMDMCFAEPYGWFTNSMKCMFVIKFKLDVFFKRLVIFRC